MTFVNDEGEVLDFNGEFAITKQAVSFFNSKIKGDFSINFKVDNNSVNRKVLGYDGPQMVNQVAFTRQSFTLMRNGNRFAKGFIVIQNDEGDELDCFFISGNSNWMNLLTGLITELDYTGVTNGTDYTTLLEADTVEVSFGVGSATANAVTSGVCFPVLDWAYNGNKGNNYWFMSLLQDVKGDSEQGFMDFYPCFFLHTLVKEIVLQKGLKITGNILTDPLFNTLILTPKSGLLKRETINATTATGSAFSTSAGPVQITGFTVTSDPENCFASNVYTANRSSRLVVTVNVIDASSGTVGCNGTITLRKNGSTFYTFGVQYDGAGEGVHRIWIDDSFTFVLNAVEGDTIDLALARSGAAGTISVTCNLKIEIPTQLIVSDYILPSEFLSDITCLDIIKFVVSFFGCSVYFSEHSKTLWVNIIEKIKEEEADDWSDYYVSHKVDYTIDSAANNYIRLSKSDETALNGYNNTRFQKYGEANITTDNTLKETNDLFKIPFSPTGYLQATNGFWLANPQLIKLVDQEPIVYTSITDLGGLALYNYPTREDYPGFLQVVRIVDDVRGDIGYYATTSGTSTTIRFKGLSFTGTGTGKIYPQAVEYRETTSRLLVLTNNVPATDISGSADFNLEDTFMDGPAPKTHVPYAYFAKSITGDTIDSLKANAAPGNPDISTFTDPDVKTLYFRKIGRMLGNPTINAKMLLPESIFQEFDFQGFIYLKTPNLTGHFFVESIMNYRDSNTPVDVKLLML